MKGSLIERSPGRWAIILDAKDPITGERKRRWHSFAGTKRQAQIRCAELVAELQSGTSVDPSKITVVEFLDRFDRDWAALHVSARSGDGYGFALDHVRRHLGDRRLQKVSPADIAALYASLTREGLAPRTTRMVHTALHRALGQAKNWGILRDNPADIAKPPKAPNKETPMLQPSDAAGLLDRLRRQPLYLTASLALGTGMRHNEMLGLRWHAVDLDPRRVTIDPALDEPACQWMRVNAPQTRHGSRTISLPAHLVPELRQHWREQQEQRLGMGLGKAPETAPVFAPADGQHLSPNAITKAWPVAMAAIGMPAVTLHSLPHTHASIVVNAGLGIFVISPRLGHSSPTITLNVYGHLIHGTDDRAAQIMDAAFGSKMVASSDRMPEK